MAGEKESACCVRGYHVYKDIWAAAIWEVLVCSMEPTNVSKIFVVKLYSRKIVVRFLCTKIFFSENKVNYSMKITAPSSWIALIIPSVLFSVYQNNSTQ